MRWILGLGLAILVAWYGYWFVGSSYIEKQAAAFVSQQEGKPDQVHFDSLSVSGFPGRFDVEIIKPSFTNEIRAFSWQAPKLNVYAMTWKPWHVLATLPGLQEFDLGAHKLTLNTVDLLASLRAKPNMNLPLAEARLNGADITFASGDFNIALAGLSFAISDRGQSGSDWLYDLGLKLKDLSPDSKIMAPLSEQTQLPQTIALLGIDAQLSLSSELNRFAGDTKPKLTALLLRDSVVTWGDMSIAVSGQLAPDDKGFTAGTLSVKITNWQSLPKLLAAFNVTSPEGLKLLNLSLGAMAKPVEGAANPNETLITLPLILKDGRVALGPLPLGQAPKWISN